MWQRFPFRPGKGLFTSFSRFRRSRITWLLSAALLGIAALSGCARNVYVESRKTRENPLANSLNLFSYGGPDLTERTKLTLRRYDLDDEFETNCEFCIQQVRKRIEDNPNSELVHALSELAYVQGKRAESQGRTADALNSFGLAITNSYDYLFDDQLQLRRNVYDPQFRSMCDLYNQALEDTLRLLCKENRIRPGQTYTIETPDKKFIVRTEMRGNWDADEFDHYEFVSDYDIKKLRNRHTTYGLGVPLIAVRKGAQREGQEEKHYPNGLSYGVTALMRCVASGEEDDPTKRVCVLEFFDPLVANQIELGGGWVPLETDLTTPLAYFLDSPEFRKRNAATEGLLNPNVTQSRRGLYMLEPYDPNRIPVLMVHGLWSSPLTWMDMFNDLRSFPEIRQRYQFWFYLYPSGQPFWISATQLRSDLAMMRRSFDPGHRDAALDKMVLVGHSMGGLVSRLQTVESKDDFWRIVSDREVEDASQALQSLSGPEEDRIKLISALFFRPNQSIQRVVTIGTPHRGSEFANKYTRWLARRFIKLPQMAVNAGDRLIRLNPNIFRNTNLLTTANAIDSLAPESPIFPVLMRAQRSPNVKYHNIVGVLKDGSIILGKDTPNDGVVDYTSATMNDVESEAVVNCEHTKIHMTPKAIFEVRRILLSHLREVDQYDRIASPPRHSIPDPRPIRRIGMEDYPKLSEYIAQRETASDVPLRR